MVKEDPELENMVCDPEYKDRELSEELVGLKKAIEDKNHNYNIITDETQRTNKKFYEDKCAIDALWANANKVLAGEFSHHNPDEATLANEPISKDTTRMELYTEKITIWEKGILKDVLVVIY